MKQIQEISILLVIASLLFVATSVYASHPKYSQPGSSEKPALVNEATSIGLGEQTLQSGSVSVPILIYHSVRPPYEGETQDVKDYTVSPENLDAQLASIRDNGYTVISLDRLVERLNKGTPIPAKSVVLTFDDGWENQIVYALPILKKYGDIATFFVYTHALGIRNFMTWADLKLLQATGMSIGDHTKTHPYLFKITDPTKMEDEILNSKKLLEDFLGKPVTNFAYPFGHGNDLALDVIKKAGFISARTTYSGVRNSEDDLYGLHGFLVQDSPQYVQTVLDSIGK